ncbi:MAG: GNAT family N-acetyltransferase, partial [Chloroflexota bacterium]
QKIARRNPMTDPITFRPIAPDDIRRLHTWRNTPHVSTWWVPHHPSYETARAEYMAYMKPEFGVDAFIWQIDGVDAGYIQKWAVRTFPDYKPHVQLTDETVGIDVFIGETDYLHQGWGPRVIRQFICQHIFSDATVPECIIDPLPDNTAAIRAYEKVGFRHAKTFTHDNLAVYLMRLPRANLSCD